ncbi:putative protein BRICK1-A [Chionoecetes opilio]|uniref:Protein BRICK1 n=1 Tax=Chionoecetes opilio TaxID=41210 RepID=A0A8J4YB61_CHIOP|nr:putative protein BRICK1-A [Chionoecetes opilio]
MSSTKRLRVNTRQLTDAPPFRSPLRPLHMPHQVLCPSQDQTPHCPPTRTRPPPPLLPRGATTSTMSNRNQVITQQIQQDWVNREYIEVITSNIKRIADFLNSFDMSCRSKLSQLNEKLTMLERRIEYLEARVTKGETLN